MGSEITLIIEDSAFSEVLKDLAIRMGYAERTAKLYREMAKELEQSSRVCKEAKRARLRELADDYDKECKNLAESLRLLGHE